MSDILKSVHINEYIEIILESNPSTGYRWEHVSKENFDFLNARWAEDYSSRTTVGSPVKMIYTLVPMKVGEFNLRFELKRPWEKNTQAIDVYEETIVVYK